MAQFIKEKKVGDLGAVNIFLHPAKKIDGGAKKKVRDRPSFPSPVPFFPSSGNLSRSPFFLPPEKKKKAETAPLPLPALFMRNIPPPPFWHQKMLVGEAGSDIKKHA